LAKSARPALAPPWDPDAPGRLAAGLLRPAGAAGASGSQGGGVGEIGQTRAGAAGDARGYGRGLQEEDRAEQAQGDEDEAADHRVGALDRAPLVPHQGEDELEDDDHQGEEDEIVHRLAQPAEEEAAGGVEQGAGDEDRTQGHQQGQGQLGDQDHAEAERRGQGSDDEDRRRDDIGAGIEGRGVSGDVLTQPGGIGHELVEGGADARRFRPADGAGQDIGQAGEERLGDEAGIGGRRRQGVDQSEFDRADGEIHHRLADGAAQDGEAVEDHIEDEGDPQRALDFGDHRGQAAAEEFVQAAVDEVIAWLEDPEFHDQGSPKGRA